MAVTTDVFVEIEGERIECHADGLDSAPIVVDSLVTQWGKDDYQQTSVGPSTATFSMVDSTGIWADRIRTGDAVGLRVEFLTTGEITGGGVPSGWRNRIVFFRGRISAATAKPTTIRASDNRVVWRVDVDLADRVADLGNINSNKIRLDREVAQRRRTWIAATGRPVSQIEAIDFWQGYQNSSMAGQEDYSASLLESLSAFYLSLGADTWSFNHAANKVDQFYRLAYDLSTYPASYESPRGAVAIQAADLTPASLDFYPGIAMHGCEIEGEVSITAEVENDINRLECSWRDGENPVRQYFEVTTTRDGVAPGDGVRTMSWDSWLDNGYAVDPTMDNVWNRARQEGRQPRHPEITVTIGHRFRTLKEFDWYIRSHADGRVAYIAGNLPYAWIMGNESEYAPILGFVGGEVHYSAADGFVFVFKPHWVYNTGAPIRPATWGSLRQRRSSSTTRATPWWWSSTGSLPANGQPLPDREIRWGDHENGRWYYLDKSLFWSDMRHLESTNASSITDSLR